MRGIVNTDVNERERPTVNSRILRFYGAGDTVEITEQVLGDPYDSDDVWYKLASGAFVWNGAVDVDIDCTGLTQEDREQWLICYRKIDGQGRPDMFSKFPPATLSFSKLMLPADSAGVRAEHWTPKEFAVKIANSVNALANPRQHVFVYIHGYQLLSSLKLDLLCHFVQNYTASEDNTIAKVLFMAWPAQGGPSRKTVDDRSLKAGQEFTENNLFNTFRELSAELAKTGKSLNLIVHSFGHQLLNGMLNPDPAHVGNIPGGPLSDGTIPPKIFENVFLMAPDVTHLTVQQGGQTIKNYFADEDGIDFHYEFTRLKQIANQVYIFHDKYDYLLYSSTKKFVGGHLQNVATPTARFNLTKDYRNLGNYGDQIDPPINRIQGFEYIDLEELIGNDDPDGTNEFPFRRIRKSARRQVDKVVKSSDYDGINAGKIIFNLKRFPNHHRYLFTCKLVVDKVLSLLQ